MTVVYGNTQQPIRRSMPTTGESMGSTAIEGTDTIRDSLEGNDPEALHSWVDAQIPYRNLASDQTIADRARGFVTTLFKQFEQKTANNRDKWLVIERLLRGESYTEATYAGRPVHVPELYKAREVLIPRLREAVLDYDPPFEVVGREQMDVRQELQIRETLRYQLDKAGFDRMVEPALRLLLTYGFCVVKTWWSSQTEKRVVREVKRTIDKNGVKRVITRKEKEVITYNGPKCRLVDPFSFFVDTNSSSVQESTFVGDSCVMTYDEIEALGKMGVYENYQELLVEEPKSDPYRTRALVDRSQDLTPNNDAGHLDGGPKKFIVSEFWGLFDPDGTGRTREFVITIANNKTVLRVQENPFDDKHRPYAVARCQAEAFTFFNVGPLDHGVHIQLQMDDLRTLLFEAQKLAMCPIGVASDDAEIPESLLGILPGTVFRGQRVDWMKVQSPIGEARYMEDILRRDIEEVTGAPRIFEGGGENTTATEVERKIQEGNKRTRGLIFSFTGLMESLLQQMHSLNAQYMTQSMKFRILGTAGVHLDAYEEVGPETFNSEIDFKFVGIANLGTLGLRATQLQQFLTIMAPFLQAYPNVVDVPKLLQQLYKHLCGDQLAEDIVKVPPTLDTMIPQKEENILLAQGQRVQTHDMDDDKAHLKDLEPIFQNFERYSVAVQNVFMMHAQEHATQMQRKAVQKKAVNSATPKVASAQNPDELGDSQRGTQEARGPQGPATMGGPGQSMSGETPGPERGGAVPSADRPGGMFQTQNMA